MRFVWHRGDLRTHDHPALTAAAEAGPVVGVVVLDPRILDATSPRRRALFLRNVRALRASYEERGGVLVVRHGLPEEELPALARELGGVVRVHAIASYTPYGVYRDGETADALAEQGVGVRWHDGAYVRSPGSVRTADGSNYGVYSPFARKWKSLGSPDPLPPPDRIPVPELPGDFDPGDVPEVETDVAIPEPGEDAALAALERFVEDGLTSYADRRDLLDGSGTSRLGIYINIGVLSPRTALARAEAAGGSGVATWVRELAWRDFLTDLVYHRPDMPDAPYQPRWSELEWVGGDEEFEAWRDARTGIPAVDAAMRQLRETGWISNRARMIAGQFLSKNLRVDWRRGEAVFKDWLLDGDTAVNLGNWQWVAGLGVDNAPYFRVMNPVTQAGKHDPEGEWLREWAPDSEGRPEAAEDAVAEPKESRAAYIEAAERVPSADAADAPPEPRRPELRLATEQQLQSIEGIGPATAAGILDTLADRGDHPLEEVPGVGASLAAAIRKRFTT